MFELLGRLLLKSELTSHMIKVYDLTNIIMFINARFVSFFSVIQRNLVHVTLGAMVG